MFLIFLLLFFVLSGVNCVRNKNPLSLGKNNDAPLQLKVEVGTPIQLTKHGAAPDWSPDGKGLVYDAGDIFVIPDTGGTPVQLTHDYNCNQGKMNNYPSWSPDGTTIAFNSNQGDAGNFKVFTVPASGGASTQLTPDSLFVAGCDWSPDGKQIVFYAQSWGYDLWTVSFPDGRLTRLPTGGKYYLGYPKYSPNGSRIAVEGGFGTSQQIWTIASDGTDPIQITQGEGDWPCWSPDGKWIAFCSDRSGNYDIYIIPSTGGEAIRITSSPEQEVRPAWSPDGKKVAFDTNVSPSNKLGIWVVSISIQED